MRNRHRITEGVVVVVAAALVACGSTSSSGPGTNTGGAGAGGAAGAGGVGGTGMGGASGAGGAAGAVATCALCAIEELVCFHSDGAESITLIPVVVGPDGCQTQNPISGTSATTWSFECDPLRACNSGECYDVTHDPANDAGFPVWWWKRSNGTVVTCGDAKPRR